LELALEVRHTLELASNVKIAPRAWS
jgi:hypothetical protein